MGLNATSIFYALSRLRESPHPSPLPGGEGAGFSCWRNKNDWEGLVRYVPPVGAATERLPGRGIVDRRFGVISPGSALGAETGRHWIVGEISLMCGIAGAIDMRGRREFAAARLLAMTAAIAHRGPDDEQIHIEPGVALGARRLSIVDLAGGRQPISNEDGSVWVTQNGELFEYPELQQALTRPRAPAGNAMRYRIVGPSLRRSWGGLFREGTRAVCGRGLGSQGANVDPWS